MKIVVIFIFSFLPLYIQGQDFNTSRFCNVNVNESQNFRDIVKRATFKITFVGPAPGSCTGTLINRDIEQNQLGTFFMLAKHCVDGIDVNRLHEFYFNYQAPNPSDNNSTPLSNRGIVQKQSNSTGTISSGSTTVDGYHYFHRSPIRIVSANFWGDFALCEILTPIPPHFNVAYAGWNPGIGTFLPIPPIPPFYNEIYFNPHHPMGDIKKMSSTSTIISAPTDLGCRIVTKVVDYVFGWIWGRTWSTEVICKYSELPWAYVPVWDIGHNEKGSSGSGLFNGNNRLLGMLSGSLGGCQFRGTTTFGKFRSNYYVQSTKNTLNPENKFWIDQFGIEGRTITCYQNLNNLSGQYFAANAYQANNKITLQSSTTVSSNGPLRIHPGADYSFVAGQSITLNPGFEVVLPQAGETMGVFEAKISSCVVPRSDESRRDIPASIVQRAKNLQLPQYKPFNPHIYLNSDKGLVDLDSQSEIQTYPNPSSDGNFTARFIVDAKKGVNLSFTDLLGKTLFSTKYNCIQGENYFPLDLSEKGLSAGIYFVILDDGNSRRVKKVVIK